MSFMHLPKPDYQYTSQADKQGPQYLKSQAADKKITGTIVEHDGNPLPGVSVIVLGTPNGSTSDEKGLFNLDKVPGDAAIVVTFVG